jgi:hypothetical protein
MAREGLIAVNKPAERKRVVRSGGRFGQFLKLAGAVVGGAAGFAGGGGPLGAAQGAVVGGSAGEMVGGIVDPVKEKVVTERPTDFGARPQTSAAIQRRSEQLTQDNLQLLEQAEVAAQELPEQERQILLPNLTQAKLLERKKRGIA